MTKENKTVVYPPNKPLERNLAFSEKPVIHDDLFFIDLNSKSEAILGSSSVRGTLWEGTIFSFDNPKSLSGYQYSGYYINSTSSDGKFLSDDIIAVAEDIGVLHIIRMQELKNLETYVYYRHFGRIPQLAVWKNTSRVLTCVERTLLIWDINALSSSASHEYRDYHTETINSVDALNGNENIFASAGTDRKACIWDARSPKVASLLYTNEFSPLTAIAWNRKDENKIIIGSEGGDLYLVDKREPREVVKVNHSKKTNIYRICGNEAGLFGVCDNSTEVIVVDDDLKVQYVSDEHQDFVRGLSWCNGILYSCGFKKSIVKHII